ncbi:UNVERIFIED_CONTAM: hypothetical protein FKN15_013631, partial [Acipenser sinensis]
REDREQFRRKSFFPPHVRDRSPNKGPAYYRNSPGGRRGSPHSRSGSSVSNKSFSPDKNKPSSYQAQHNKTEQSQKEGLNLLQRVIKDKLATLRRAERLRKRYKKKERARANFYKDPFKFVKKLFTSEKNGTLKASKVELERYLEETHTDSKRQEPMSIPSDIPPINPPEYQMEDCAPKWKEVEQAVYRQDCETFGMVVKMLVNKDPTLEKQVQLSLRENLREIGERCIEEIKNFISEYDNAPAQPE